MKKNGNKLILAYTGWEKHLCVYFIYEEFIMNFLFKVFISCSRNPKAKLSLNRQTGCRQGDSHFVLRLLHFVVYFGVAVLSLTKKQVLSPILLESSSFNHPPSVCRKTLIIRLRCAGWVPSNSPFYGQFHMHGHTGNAYSSSPGAWAAHPGQCFGCSSFLPQAPGSISSCSFGWEVALAGEHLMRACIQCPHLPTHVWALWDLHAVALVTLLTP